MTIKGALKELSDLLEAEDIPVWYKTSIKKVMETIEMESMPRMGNWVKTPKAVMGEGYMWYCDKCEHQVYQDSSRPYPSEKYCPNCGSYMKNWEKNYRG